ADPPQVRGHVGNDVRVRSGGTVPYRSWCHAGPLGADPETFGCQLACRPAVPGAGQGRDWQGPGCMRLDRSNPQSVLDAYRRHLSRGRAGLAELTGAHLEWKSSGARVWGTAGREVLDCGGG